MTAEKKEKRWEDFLLYLKEWGKIRLQDDFHYKVILPNFYPDEYYKEINKILKGQLVREWDAICIHNITVENMNKFLDFLGYKRYKQVEKILFTGTAEPNSIERKIWKTVQKINKFVDAKEMLK